MEQPPGRQLPTLQDANIYPENRVVTYPSETNQPVYTSQSNAEFVTNRELVSPHIIQDGASNFVEGKELGRKAETDAMYGETTEMVVATPGSSRQIVQTPDTATGAQTSEATGEIVANADATQPGYGDRIAVAVPVVSPHLTTVVDASAPVVLVPDANVRPVLPPQPSPQLINSRDLISSVIDSTRHAMPAALSNVSARQKVSSSSDSSKRQPTPAPPLPIYRPVSKPEVHHVNSSLKQLITNPVLREGISVSSSGGIYADNYQYFLKADGTVSRVVSAPTQGAINKTVGYIEKREVDSQVDKKRYIDSKELVNAQSISNVQDSEASIAVPAPVTYIDNKLLKQQQQQQQQQETNSTEFVNEQRIGEMRYVQNSEDTVAVPMPVAYADSRFVQHVQPETATFNHPSHTQVIVEYSNRVVNSSGNETIPMSHAIVSYPENRPLVPPVVAEEGHKDVPENPQGVMNNVVNDTVKAAIESSGIMPPTTEQTSELRTTIDNHINHVEMQPDANRVNGDADTLQTENNENNKVNEQVSAGPECETNNSLVHMKR